MTFQRAVLQSVTPGFILRSLLDNIDYAAISHTNMAFWWWRLSHRTSVVAMHAGGIATMKKTCDELRQLGCHLLDSVPGRVFFRSIAPDSVQQSTLVERASIVVMRYTNDPVGTFLTFEGATRKKVIDQIMATLLTVNWAWPLAAWSVSTRRQNPMYNASACTFRVTAKRTTKSKFTKKLLPSDVFARLVGARLAQHFGWRVDVHEPGMEVELRLSRDELLVFLPAWVQRSSYQSSAGLHPCVAWALAKSANIRPGDSVLDPMCGRGVLLCEAALGWRHARYMGCDISLSQLRDAAKNVTGSRAGDRVALHVADAAYFCGLPFPDGSIDRILTDMPFGKQFGSLEQNETVYPRVLAEMARVLRCDGRAVILTSADNQQLMQACLSHTRPRFVLDAAKEPPTLVWEVVHRFGFMLFTSMRARIYILRRTAQPAPHPDVALATCRRALGILRGWRRHHALRRAGGGEGGGGASGGSGGGGGASGDGGGDKVGGEAGDGDVVANAPPAFFVEKLGGGCSRLPWDDGTSWRTQWVQNRPPMVRWGTN